MVNDLHRVVTMKLLKYGKNINHQTPKGWCALTVIQRGNVCAL